jgi:hypothetical protein
LKSATTVRTAQPTVIREIKKPIDENTIEAHGDPQYGSAILSGFNTG